MKMRAILMSAAEVRALLRGQKTQIRNVVRPHRSNVDGRAPYAVDEILYVREALGTLLVGSNDLHYLADGRSVDPARVAPGFVATAPHVPNIFMPVWASRLYLAVTAVRIERLQDITQADAVAEGFAGPISRDTAWQTGMTPVAAFRRVWDEVKNHRFRARWDDNPVVAVSTFTVGNWSACAAASQITAAPTHASAADPETPPKLPSGAASSVPVNTVMDPDTNNPGTGRIVS